MFVAHNLHFFNVQRQTTKALESHGMLKPLCALAQGTLERNTSIRKANLQPSQMGESHLIAVGVWLLIWLQNECFIICIFWICYFHPNAFYLVFFSPRPERIIKILSSAFRIWERSCFQNNKLGHQKGKIKRRWRRGHKCRNGSKEGRCLTSFLVV